ncbi:MAG: 2-C-methyl-D-erythritol 4-phosphate cytidylyltransferase [Thermodesulfobacterium geofontis]|uniref:2-C-methyl-D-erythritol 4-phosphate cytidylyltransferase n=1 Tax=Thermodesulfobacterium geofontis TaxID=1295609 RepID=A0A2N7QG17_9BACT|nr:MAG: 2-C-methyl-D-erythritol 4-phosphate cytidylyltransferase [Thermodesulfobacterium geofontis]PMP97892.1 MAG: 2-C-methyl-D-erythritol 4-phosphate cytidylyltransferase [Thermodesulfobacterium geofontis]HEM55960.1 2-C-methyl-D-erythritol 4-phosphate cytidylyltransferase [Thermodesulfobium narugense]
MIIAIVPSAGKGERIKAEKPKQFLEIKGIPLLIYTLLKFEKHPQIDGIILSVSSEYISYTEKLISSYNLKKVLKITEGGKTRQDSVFKGIKVAPPKAEIFLVHDAVRPFVSSDLISKIIDNTKILGACVPAIPIRDTINRVFQGEIIENINRTNLFCIQTPQGIRAKILKNLLEKAQKENLIFSDESTLLLHYGYKVKIIEGFFLNFKITYPEDLFLAEKLIDCKIEDLL